LLTHRRCVSSCFPYLQTNWCVRKIRHLRTLCFSKHASLTISNKSKCLEMLTAYAKPAYSVSNERSLRLSLLAAKKIESKVSSWLVFFVARVYYHTVLTYASSKCFMFPICLPKRHLVNCVLQQKKSRWIQLALLRPGSTGFKFSCCSTKGHSQPDVLDFCTP
jgi:hypothetical protein